MQMNQTRKLVYAALCVAVGILLPSIFHATHISGTAFLPMHIPALLCGLLCGPVYGGLCGAVLPFLNVLILGMPPVFPTGISMAVELLCYGVVAGLLIQRFHVYVALIGAMLAGRVAMGIANVILLVGISGKAYTLPTFL